MILSGDYHELCAVVPSPFAVITSDDNLINAQRELG
jgi:hypothetical protein